MRLRNLVAAAALVLAAPPLSAQQRSDLSIAYESYTLPNGLTVVLHEDRSDPIAAVAILYHVGSNREVQGRTGFAHLFEHMMFQASQHVGQDQFFRKIQEAGGTLNGGTSYDNTTYFQVVPNNALEMVLWLEADRMGYLLPTVTDEAFLNQQDVVQNEKRQRVDNVPYGHTQHVLGKLLYPEDHPYNWSVIGSFEDLANATMADIQQFFRTWYGPNNATLVVAGDFEVARTKAWIEKYFGDIPASPAVTDPEPRPAVLTATRKVYHEDNFATSPELTMNFPTVERFHPDAYPLQLLGLLLSDGKKAPLYKTIVEGQLAPRAGAFQSSMEMAGTFRISVRAFPGKSLDDVEGAVMEAFRRFEAEGFSEADLARIKAQYETGFYNGISSILGKAFQLANYNEFAGSPGYVTEDLQRYLDVTSADVRRVYDKYLKGKPYAATSFVPKGQVALVAAGSELFPIEEESIAAAGVDAADRAMGGAVAEALPSSFDRSMEPSKGPAPEVAVPGIWSHTYANGLRIYGIEQRELPLIQFGLTLEGGLLLDDPQKVGVANLMTDIMMQGTRNRTPIELEEAIDALGASISMFTGRESISMRANLLKSKLRPVYALFEEILLEPRWDAAEFARLQRETTEAINRQGTSAAAVANNVFNRLVYGEDHILGYATFGTAETVAAITVDDLKAFYQANYAPNVSYVTVVGDIGREEAVELFRPLESKWARRAVAMPTYTATPTRAAVYFVDIPGAKQSEIRVGHAGPRVTDPDYYPAYFMNYALGGSFNGRVNMILREEKGYTYGARSGFSESGVMGAFTASSAVRSNVTLESAQIFKAELERYRDGISAEDLAFTQNALVQGNALRFETLGALMGMLGDVGTYELPFDYVKKWEGVARTMTLDEHRALAWKYIDPDRMIFLVVGDAATQLEGLRELGLGTPILLDREGKRVPTTF